MIWPNGQVKYRGRFVNGIEVGQQVCYWDDGTIAQVSWRDSGGCPRGTTVSFYPDGDKEKEETWDEIERDPGTFVSRCYDSKGDVFLRSTYRMFQQIDSWQRPKTEDYSSGCDPQPPRPDDLLQPLPSQQMDEDEGDLDNSDNPDDLTLKELVELKLCSLRAVFDAVSCDESELPELVDVRSRLESLLAAIERGSITQEQAEREYKQIEWD